MCAWWSPPKESPYTCLTSTVVVPCCQTAWTGRCALPLVLTPSTRRPTSEHRLRRRFPRRLVGTWPGKCSKGVLATRILKRKNREYWASKKSMFTHVHNIAPHDSWPNSWGPSLAGSPAVLGQFIGSSSWTCDENSKRAGLGTWHGSGYKSTQLSFQDVLQCTKCVLQAKVLSLHCSYIQPSGQALLSLCKQYWQTSQLS